MESIVHLDVFFFQISSRIGYVSTIYFFYHIYLLAKEKRSLCHIEVREKLVGVYSLFPLCGSLGLTLSHEA